MYVHVLTSPGGIEDFIVTTTIITFIIIFINLALNVQVSTSPGGIEDFMRRRVRRRKTGTVT